MEPLLKKVELAMAIHAHRRTRGLLEGEYGSIHKGRSLDFDDLREYVPGDDVKDLDWKATARSPHPLVKRYVAVRKHTVLLVVGTGREMAALADPVTPKRDVAVLAAGVLGYLAVRHSDLIGLLAGDAGGVQYTRPGGSQRHLEQVLRTVHERITVDAPPGDLPGLLDYLTRAIRVRTILVLLTDGAQLTEAVVARLPRLVAQHELLHLAVDDLAPTDGAIAGREVVDVVSGARLPALLRRDAALGAELSAARAQRRQQTVQRLARLGVASESMRGEAEVVPAVLRLLERHRRSRV